MDRLTPEREAAIREDVDSMCDSHIVLELLEELERLRAELQRAHAHNQQQPCTYQGPHPCHLQGDGRRLYHCPGRSAPMEPR